MRQRKHVLKTRIGCEFGPFMQVFTGQIDDICRHRIHKREFRIGRIQVTQRDVQCEIVRGHHHQIHFYTAGLGIGGVADRIAIDRITILVRNEIDVGKLNVFIPVVKWPPR